MSVSTTLISILMPVYNAAPFLDECIESIRAQSHNDWELLAVDDHSSDTSASVLRLFQQLDERIQVFSHPGTGIQSALRHAFDRSRGRYITRMDADDRMHTHKLRTLALALEAAGKKTVVAGQVAYFSEGTLGEGYRKYTQWLNQVVAENHWRSQLYRECVLPSTCWMARREELAFCGAFEGERYPEDYDLCFRFLAGGMAFRGHPEVLHFWRDHPQRSSRTQAIYRDNSFFRLKVDWFLRLDRNFALPLLLWGAGKRGKAIARLFNSYGLDYHWITENPSKSGREVYGKVLGSGKDLQLHNRAQVCIAVSRDDDRRMIEEKLLEAGFRADRIFPFR